MFLQLYNQDANFQTQDAHLLNLDRRTDRASTKYSFACLKPTSQQPSTQPRPYGDTGHAHSHPGQSDIRKNWV